MVEIEFVFCIVACVIPYSTPPPFKFGELSTSLHLLPPSFNPQGWSLCPSLHFTPLPGGISVNRLRSICEHLHAHTDSHIQYIDCYLLRFCF